ncbi:hypothetical protein L6452_42718 [Arctium lappa]|uniref:Uncharacterized protein n=1 Tax=Arctium lappa TaxID=4217 RepID=A0ACB8XJQ1_ARCLA|nr:hypothetical protein L6452_42718 [Arctium lappa]
MATPATPATSSNPPPYPQLDIKLDFAFVFSYLNWISAIGFFCLVRSENPLLSILTRGMKFLSSDLLSEEKKKSIVDLLRYQKEWLSWALKQEESASRGASASELQRSSSASSSGMMGRSMNEMQIEVQRRLHEQLELKEEKSRLNAKLKNTGKELDKRKEEKKKHMVEIEKLRNDLGTLTSNLTAYNQRSI